MARRTATRKLQPELPQDVHARPADWARSYQRPVLKYMLVDGGKRAVLVWHRKAGKDWTALNIAALLGTQRPGLYAHVFPTLKLGREVIWEGITSQEGPLKGRKYLSVFPPQFVRRENVAEMMVELEPMNGSGAGSIYQVMGADNLPKRRGPNCVGLILSEYQEMDPAVLDEIFEPQIVANHGWIIFCFTPQGKNHAYKLVEAVRGKPGWFLDVRTIEQTFLDAPGEPGGPVVLPEYIQEMRERGTPEDIIQQEYYCSFEGRLHGTIYGDLLRLAREQGRIGNVPYDPQYPVGVMLDLGRGDATAIWRYQAIGRQIRFIGYYENRLKGADYYAQVLKNTQGIIERLILPWDATQEHLSAAQTAYQYFQSVGFRGVELAPRWLVQQGIDAVRRLFSRFYFDAVNCARGIECLENYRRKYDDAKNEYADEPLHDQFSHGADALRTGVQAGLDRPLEFWTMEDRPRYCQTMADALQPLSGRRYARHDVGGWG